MSSVPCCGSSYEGFALNARCSSVVDNSTLLELLFFGPSMVGMCTDWSTLTRRVIVFSEGWGSGGIVDGPPRMLDACGCVEWSDVLVESGVREDGGLRLVDLVACCTMFVGRSPDVDG